MWQRAAFWSAAASAWLWRARLPGNRQTGRPRGALEVQGFDKGSLKGIYRGPARVEGLNLRVSGFGVGCFAGLRGCSV